MSYFGTIEEDGDEVGINIGGADNRPVTPVTGRRGSLVDGIAQHKAAVAKASSTRSGAGVAGQSHLSSALQETQTPTFGQSRKRQHGTAATSTSATNPPSRFGTKKAQTKPQRVPASPSVSPSRPQSPLTQFVENRRPDTSKAEQQPRFTTISSRTNRDHTTDSTPTATVDGLLRGLIASPLYHKPEGEQLRNAVTAGYQASYPGPYIEGSWGKGVEPSVTAPQLHAFLKSQLGPHAGLLDQDNDPKANPPTSAAQPDDAGLRSGEDTPYMQQASYTPSADDRPKPNRPSVETDQEVEPTPPRDEIEASDTLTEEEIQDLLSTGAGAYRLKQMMLERLENMEGMSDRQRRQIEAQINAQLPGDEDGSIQVALADGGVLEAAALLSLLASIGVLQQNPQLADAIDQQIDTVGQALGEAPIFMGGRLAGRAGQHPNTQAQTDIADPIPPLEGYPAEPPAVGSNTVSTPIPDQNPEDYIMADPVPENGNTGLTTITPDQSDELQELTPPYMNSDNRDSSHLSVDGSTPVADGFRGSQSDRTELEQRKSGVVFDEATYDAYLEYLETEGNRYSEERRNGQRQNIAPSQSFIWQQLRNQGWTEDGRRIRVSKNRNGELRYYTWDGQHGDIEVWDRRDRHIGAIDSVTGEWISPSKHPNLKRAQLDEYQTTRSA